MYKKIDLATPGHGQVNIFLCWHKKSSFMLT